MEIPLMAFLIGITSCEERQPSTASSLIESEPNSSATSSYPRSSDSVLMHALLDSALNKGNVRAYSRVANYYIGDGRGDEFFYYALQMANRYNEPLAHFHVYIILSNSHTRPVYTRASQMDQRSKDLAMCYLLQAYELGEEGAIHQLLRIYPDTNAIPSLDSYRKAIR